MKPHGDSGWAEPVVQWGQGPAAYYGTMALRNKETLVVGMLEVIEGHGC